MLYLYTVWLRDSELIPTDEDYEFPACFLVEAQTTTQARNWGDLCAKSHCDNSDNEHAFLTSSVELAGRDVYRDLISIRYGEHVSDDKFG